MGLRMRGHVVRPEESGWILSCLCTCCPEDGISSGSAVVGERIGCSSCTLVLGLSSSWSWGDRARPGWIRTRMCLGSDRKHMGACGRTPGLRRGTSEEIESASERASDVPFTLAGED